MASRLASKVVIYTNGSEEVKETLERALTETILDVKVDSRKIIRVQKLDINSNERLAVHFADGSKDVLGFMVHVPNFEVNIPKDWMDNLGLELDDMKNLKVDGMGQTTSPGIMAAGDGSAMMKTVSRAIFEGNIAGGRVVHELVLGK
jgi:pyruvate/2-oxoglutarate dehydrogenase complex dihydrolipoamide dehydrogenase (E3) component